jgi:hypothetical protein
MEDLLFLAESTKGMEIEGEETDGIPEKFFYFRGPKGLRAISNCLSVPF